MRSQSKDEHTFNDGSFTIKELEGMVLNRIREYRENEKVLSQNVCIYLSFILFLFVSYLGPKIMSKLRLDWVSEYIHFYLPNQLETSLKALIGV